MEYLYSPKANYDDFSSGRVLYNARGVPNFPVRLQAEIFCRARQYLEKETELCVYDPCCGGGYSLTILGFLFGDHIARICGSDIDAEMIRIAENNLSLLSKEGMAKRVAEIESLYGLYHKESHYEALESCKRLGAINTSHIQTELFAADCTLELPEMTVSDIIITDVPYGNLVQWSDPDKTPMDAMMHSLHEIASEKTVLAVCMDKKQKIVSDEWTRVEKANIGKRRFEIYKYCEMF